MNVGNSLVMSPSLVTKYLDAGKDIASHAMLLPDGIRFSPRNTRRDWTEELLAEIRGVYREFTDNGGGTSVNLQGIRFDTKDGGVLPLDKYLNALLDERAGQSEARATSRIGLSAKYLGQCTRRSNCKAAELPARSDSRSVGEAKPGDGTALAKQISQWQHALWKFNSVGHIGKKNGPKAWMEPLTPIQSKQEVRFKIPASDAKEVTLYLAASDAGDGNKNDFVIWEQPRLVAPGQPPLLLRDVRELHRELSAKRERTLGSAAKYLAAAAQVEAGQTNVVELARAHGVERETLAAWLDYLGLSSTGPVKIEGLFTDTYTNGSGFPFINGWGKSGTPNLTANSSTQHVRIPGNMKPHSVAVHPSPKLAAAVGWRSPVAGRVRVTAAIQHAHPECGNGVTWSLELRRGSKRQRLANGLAQGAKEVKPAPIENLAVQPGDVVSLLIGPRDANHSCDLTAVDLTLTSSIDAREWDLARDVSPNVLAGNPHADRFGNEGVWHFYTEPDKGGSPGPVIPAGSLLAQWQAAMTPEERSRLAGEVQSLLTASAPAKKDSPDAALHSQLTSLGGPLFSSLRSNGRESAQTSPKNDSGGRTSAESFGLDPARFTGADLAVRAPAIIEFRLPADLVAGYEFVTTGVLDKTTGAEGSVQLAIADQQTGGQFGPARPSRRRLRMVKARGIPTTASHRTTHPSS